MENAVNERIKMIIEECGYKSRRSFSEKIGVAQTSLNDILRGAEPKYSTLLKILLAEPLISAEWLLRGKGSMFLSDEQHVDESIVEQLNHRITWLEAQNALLREQAGLPSEKREGA